MHVGMYVCICKFFGRQLTPDTTRPDPWVKPATDPCPTLCKYTPLNMKHCSTCCCQVHERQSADEQDVRDQFSDEEDGDRRDTFSQFVDHRPHAHCSHGNVAIHRQADSDTFAPLRRLPHARSRDQQEPEVELTDCSSCSSVDTPPERHTVPTHRAESAHEPDTVARDDDDDDEIINVVDDLVT